MVEIVQSTIRWPDVSGTDWDVVVVGAGVAGASLVCRLAERNLKVLLVDAKSFPREKVCGGCLNERAQFHLQELEVLSRILERGACELTGYSLHIQSKHIRWQMPKMISVSRGLLDSLLVERAVKQGASFLCETRAAVEKIDGNFRLLRLQHGTSTKIVKASVVVAADGLTQSSLKELSEFQSSPVNGSRIGVQCYVDRSLWEQCSPMDKSSIHDMQMFLDRRGYVGVAPIDGDRMDIAAAIHTEGISSAHRPSDIMADILESCGVHCRGLLQKNSFLATPALTRRSSQVAAERLFLVGDAVGYIEPFTGEGMAWALAGAKALVPWIEAAVAKWSPKYVDGWGADLEQHVIRHQSFCRLFSNLSRYPRIAAMVMNLMNFAPPLQKIAMRRISGRAALECKTRNIVSTLS